MSTLASGFGRAIFEILDNQYPNMSKEARADPEYAGDPCAKIGMKMISIAKKELQGHEEDAYDSIQEFITYLCKSGFDFTKTTKSGKPGAAFWQVALRNIYTNLRMRSMSASFKKYRQINVSDEDKYASLLWHRSDPSSLIWSDEDEAEINKLKLKLENVGVDVAGITPAFRKNSVVTQSIDNAFGVRSDNGVKSSGVARIPDKNDILSDELVARSDFMNAVNSIIPDLRAELPLDSRGGYPVQRLLFDFIMNEQDSGTFFNDIKSNMGQASRFKEYCKKLAKRNNNESKIINEMLMRFESRWSGLVTDTRVKLMTSIKEFITNYLTTNEYEIIWENYYERAYTTIGSNAKKTSTH